MSLSLRLFIAYFLLMGLSVWFILQSVTTELIPGMRQSLEEVLVDTANLLAEIVEQEVTTNTLNTGRISGSMTAFHNRRLAARIYNLQRTNSNMEVYIT
ncbi:MAG: two-component system sensor histidine kinase CreC, partial [Gammaproteobacteria bacterium]|nr:two-component system sensor histidine kinase CreC [Gammaproteobacteria bacterium]